MREGTVINRLAQKLRVPANILYIAFPMMCWALVSFRWLSGFWQGGVWLTEILAAAVAVFYYILAAAYLFFIFIIRMRVYAIVGLFMVLVSCFFVWIPYNWVFAVLLAAAVFLAFYNRKSKLTAIVITIVYGVNLLFYLLIPIIKPERIAYHPSPDGRYVALERDYQLLFFGGTDVFLCHTNGPFLISDRLLYLGDNIDFGGKIEWLDENNIRIYGEDMDVIKDPVIERYTPF